MDEQKERARRAANASQFEGARRLVRLGDWGAAAAALDACDPGALDDPIEFDLVRARLLAALGKRSEAVLVLDSLGGAAAGSHAAAVSLLRGELRLASLETADDGIRLARQAMESGALSAPDAAYARGLLDDRTTEAAARFREALEHDAFHHGARGDLVLVLTMLGRLDEAELHANQGRTLFPSDPNFPFALAMIAALRGEPAAARVRLDSARKALGEDTVSRLAPLIEMANNLQSLGREADIGRLSMKTAQLLSVVNGKSRNRNTTEAPIRLNALPCLRRSYSWVQAYVMRCLNPYPMTAAEEARLARELADASQWHPEASLLFFQGSLQINRWFSGKGDAADQATKESALRLLEQAAGAPAMIPQMRPAIRRSGLVAFGALLTEFRDRGIPAGSNAADVRARAKSFAAHCLRGQAYDAETWNLVASVAALAEDPSLVRLASEDQLRSDPSNGLAKARLAIAEHKLGNHERAISLMDELRAKGGNAFYMTEIHRRRGEAVEALRGAVKRLGAAQ